MKKTLAIASLLLSGAVVLAADKPDWGPGRGERLGHSRDSDRDEDRDDRHKGRHEREDDDDSGGKAASRRIHATIIFRPGDRSIISGYYRNLPPGLAKRNGGLPPGLEKQLRRKGHLPPGLEQRVTPLPPHIEVRLPRLPTGVVRGTIGSRAIIFEQRTSLILDCVPID